MVKQRHQKAKKKCSMDLTCNNIKKKTYILETLPAVSNELLPIREHSVQLLSWTTCVSKSFSFGVISDGNELLKSTFCPPALLPLVLSKPFGAYFGRLSQSGCQHISNVTILPLKCSPNVEHSSKLYELMDPIFTLISPKVCQVPTP